MSYEIVKIILKPTLGYLMALKHIRYNKKLKQNFKPIFYIL